MNRKNKRRTKRRMWEKKLEEETEGRGSTRCT
jgi:hypothetical protein